MAFIPGLVSVTFRQLCAREIIELARRAGLEAIEWGSDVHVPPGEIALARDVRGMTEDAGLSVACYGSYYRAGDDDPETFTAVLDSARALGAPAIRIWPGRRGSAAADAAYRQCVAGDVLRIADQAAQAGVTLCYEFHQGTLTDTDDSAAVLLAATDHPHVRTLWQPPHEVPVEQACESLTRVLPRLHHIHVFHWPVHGQRAALAEGEDRWLAYLRLLKQRDKPSPLLLEFVKNDDPQQLLQDARTLRGWIDATSQ